MVKRYKITNYATGEVMTFINRRLWEQEIDFLRKQNNDRWIFTLCKNHPRHMVITSK